MHQPAPPELPSHRRLSSILSEHNEDEIFWNKNSDKVSHSKSEHKLDIAEVFEVQKTFLSTDTVVQTEVTYSKEMSDLLGANIFLKREDQQRGRTYKIRGGYYYYIKNEENVKTNGFVTASDGNFATSIAILAGTFKFNCVVFVPYSCFQHKIDRIKEECKGFVEIIQEGDDFNECELIAIKYAEEKNLDFIQPHETDRLMPGYATIGKDILDDNKLGKVDYIMVPSGGGALVTSIASFFKQVSPHTKIIAVEPETCTPFSSSILKDEHVTFEKVSRFCNGSSVKKIGKSCFNIGKTCVDGFVSVSENKLAETIIKLYSLGIICEPSGGLGVAGLTKMRKEIKGKNVVCILTGSNMDLTRLEQARELNVISKGYKNYYIIEMANRKKAIYDLITKCFKKTDAVSIQYSKNPNKEINAVLLSVESPSQEDVEEYVNLMLENKFKVENITERSEMLDLFF